MKQRLASMKRIMRVREQLKRIEETKLARLNREEAELEDKRRSIIHALNDDPSLHGLFIDDMAKRLKRVTVASHQVRHLKQLQSQHVIEQTRHYRQAENLVGTLTKDKNRADEKMLLDSMIERLSSRKHDSSLP